MQVTITLGQKAMEYVTGIPEEELSEILSDVLERSLVQQVQPLPLPEGDSKKLSGEEILNQLRELLMQTQANQSVLKSQEKDESIFPTHKEIKIDRLNSSSKNFDDGFDMFKDLFK